MRNHYALWSKENTYSILKNPEIHMAFKKLEEVPSNIQEGNFGMEAPEKCWAIEK